MLNDKIHLTRLNLYLVTAPESIAHFVTSQTKKTLIRSRRIIPKRKI